MPKPRLDLIFELEDEIRRTERELKVQRWEHEQLLQLLEKNAQQQEQYRSIRVRTWYRLKQLLRYLTVKLLNR
jgi:hypothetical protein